MVEVCMVINGVQQMIIHSVHVGCVKDH